MSGRTKEYFTQWAAQFYVAAELTRRGYLVALTLGNAPKTDLMVESPGGSRFAVDVKGLRERNWWIVRHPREDVFYVFVHVPENPEEPPRFCVMTGSEVREEVERYLEEARSRGKVIKETDYGLTWKTPFKHENRWDKLPK